ncbi:leukocyte surface antigen CD53-like [Thalassophryne amazonica]|uniref:leukocyte surface antigen CD53-like n=1 Tax=Thalassophryne amazonica TaxID=390379 RepID=UPI001471A7DF|nr:leukocyte surface antigen CD53-like [Thalassophryne amazonica]XP_034026907.1 leukocyte surface antigen CD53-like [Thalassophryne amazonica]
MAQGCLKCLKLTMCAANFLCFICGVVLLSLGIYAMVNFKFHSLLPSLASFNIANVLLISGIIITCVSFLGFLGALKENRCLLLTFFVLLFLLMLAELTAACFLLVKDKEIGQWLEKDLKAGLEKGKGKFGNSTDVFSEWELVQNTFQCCGVHNASDWGDKIVTACPTSTPLSKQKGCLDKLRIWFEDNFLTIGISIIILCIIEVLGMCFAMTLFCHISRSGLGYKL